MRIDPADSATHQTLFLNEHEDFIMVSQRHLAEPAKQGQNFRAAS